MWHSERPVAPSAACQPGLSPGCLLRSRVAACMREASRQSAAKEGSWEPRPGRFLRNSAAQVLTRGRCALRADLRLQHRCGTPQTFYDPAALEQEIEGYWVVDPHGSQTPIRARR